MITEILSNINREIENGENTIISILKEKKELTFNNSSAIICNENNVQENFGVATVLSIGDGDEILINTSNDNVFSWNVLSISEKVAIICEVELIINP